MYRCEGVSDEARSAASPPPPQVQGPHAPGGRGGVLAGARPRRLILVVVAGGYVSGFLEVGMVVVVEVGRGRGRAHREGLMVVEVGGRVEERRRHQPGGGLFVEAHVDPPWPLVEGGAGVEGVGGGVGVGPQLEKVGRGVIVVLLGEGEGGGVEGGGEEGRLDRGGCHHAAGGWQRRPRQEDRVAGGAAALAALHQRRELLALLGGGLRLGRRLANQELRLDRSGR